MENNNENNEIKIKKWTRGPRKTNYEYFALIRCRRRRFEIRSISSKKYKNLYRRKKSLIMITSFYFYTTTIVVIFLFERRGNIICYNYRK